MSPAARRNLFASLGCTLLVTVAGMGVAAGEQQTPHLTVAAALDLAERHNLDLAAVRERRAVARAGIRIARQRPNPTLSFEALRDSPHQALLYDQPLELGAKRGRRVQVAEEESALTEVEISALTRRVRRDTREAYYRVALSRAETDRLGRILRFAERLEQIAQARFEAGDIPELEVIQARLEVSRAQVDLQVAQQEQKTSLSQLNALLNASPTTPWEVSGALEDPLPPISIPELIERAHASNPELQRLSQERKIEQTRLGLLKAERIPNLDVQVGTDLNSPPDFQAGPRGQLSLLLPIFARNQGEIAQSFAQQRVLEATVMAVRRAVAGRVEAAYFDLEAKRTQVELYRQTLVPAAGRVETLAEESYRAGKANILLVLDAQRNVQSVERNYLESLFALQSAFAGLEESVGAKLDQN